MDTKKVLIFLAGAAVAYFIINQMEKNKIITPNAPQGEPNNGQSNGGNPYVPCNFIDGEIVDVVGWLNSDLPNHDFSITNESMCMGRTLPTNLNLLDVEKTMTSDTVQYRGKGVLKSASMVSGATRRDESVPIIYT